MQSLCSFVAKIFPQRMGRGPTWKVDVVKDITSKQESKRLERKQRESEEQQ